MRSFRFPPRQLAEFMLTVGFGAALEQAVARSVEAGLHAAGVPGPCAEVHVVSAIQRHPETGKVRRFVPLPDAATAQTASMRMTAAARGRCGGIARPIPASAAPEASTPGTRSSARPAAPSSRSPGVTSVTR